MPGVDVADYSSVIVDGPWRHEFVSANGARFHLAIADPAPSQAPSQAPPQGQTPSQEQAPPQNQTQPQSQTQAPPPHTAAHPASASAPLIMLLHGFGQMWWTWRQQLVDLSQRGFRVAAMDMRGVGASDKPPRGYDVPTRTRDVAGVIRSLGAQRAIVVGHGTGGEAAWAMAALQPSVTTAVAALSSPHPARVHTSGRQALTWPAWRWLALAQLPSWPERRLRDGDMLPKFFALGAAEPLAADVVNMYRTALRIPFAAHTSLEALRWSGRTSAPRPDGLRYRAAVRRGLTLPALQVHGSRDGVLRRAGIDADAAAFCRNYQFELLDGAGYFLTEEAPSQVTDVLTGWLTAQQLLP